MTRHCAKCGKRGPTVKLSRDWRDRGKDGKGRRKPLCNVCFLEAGKVWRRVV